MTEEKRKEVERLATDYVAARQRVEALMCQAMPDKQEEARAARVGYEVAVAVANEAKALLREAQKFGDVDAAPLDDPSINQLVRLYKACNKIRLENGAPFLTFEGYMRMRFEAENKMMRERVTEKFDKVIRDMVKND